jgi:prepilin-type N-terminal cleavage/methylation domain-containing protein/prepilin-type processing-associated H-X9-DG protein
MKKRGGTFGFTLVELLVVLAVIGVLAALLLPGLSRSRDTAVRIRCLGNLRQFGLASRLYWDENNGVAFRCKGTFSNGGDTWWFGWLERGAEGERAFDPTVGALYPYFKSKPIELCPALDYTSKRFKLKARGATSGYGYNRHLAPLTLSEPAFRVSSFGHPENTVLFADSGQINTFQPPASPENPLLEEFPYVARREPTVHFRHQNQANIVFLDGHADRRRPLTNSVEIIISGEITGSLPDELFGR